MATLCSDKNLAPSIYRIDDELILEYEGGLKLRYPFTEGGLSKALQHVPHVRPRKNPLPSAGYEHHSDPIVNGMLESMAKRRQARLDKAKEIDARRAARQASPDRYQASIADFLDDKVADLPARPKRINVKG